MNKEIINKIKGYGYDVEFYDISKESDFTIVLSIYRNIIGENTSRIISDPRYLKILIENNPKCLGSFTVVLLKDNNPVVLILGRIENYLIELQLGQISFFKTERKSLLIPEGGILSLDDGDSCNKQILNVLLQSFCLKKFDVIILHWVPVDSKFYEVSVKKVSWLFKNYYPYVDKHWYTDLKSSFSDLVAYKSSKERYNLRSVIRKIDNNEQIHFHYRKFSAPEEVITLMQDAEIVLKLTYQRKLGVGFWHNNHIEALFQEAADTNNLLSYVLYADSIPCAVQLGINQGETHHIIYMAHNPEFGRYSPGTYLLLKFLDYICSSHEIKVVDYGWGDGDHKRKFGTSYNIETNLIYFSPSIKGFFLSLAMNSLRFCADILKRNNWISALYEKWKKAQKK